MSTLCAKLPEIQARNLSDSKVYHYPFFGILRFVFFQGEAKVKHQTWYEHKILGRPGVHRHSRPNHRQLRWQYLLH
jgi:hypothetical protein